MVTIMTRAPETELLPSLEGFHVPAGIVVEQGVSAVLVTAGLLAVSAAILGIGISAQEFVQVSGRIVHSISADSAVAVLEVQGANNLSEFVGRSIEISRLGNKAVHSGGYVLGVFSSPVKSLPGTIGPEARFPTLIEARLDVSGVLVDTTTRVFGRLKLGRAQAALILFRLLRAHQ
jgi:hypothetical protein